MPARGLLLALMLAVSLSLTGGLLSRRSAWEMAQGSSDSVLARLLGDGRRMFANHFFAKADAYFHRGVYPSIFDERAPTEEDHMTEGTHSDHAEEAGHSEHDRDEHAEPEARDWIEGFGRHFKPFEHVHLENGSEKEMLPWLRLSAELDPHRVETYTVAAFWLRTKLGKVDDAEQFLREGLRSNPDSYEILVELGRLYEQNRKDLVHARNVFELALRNWDRTQTGATAPDKLALAQILGLLGRVEERLGEVPQSLKYYRRLKEVSPNPESVQRLIDDVELHRTKPGRQ